MRLRCSPTKDEFATGKQPAFEPVVLTGLRGYMVEVLKDASIRFAPVDADAALERPGELSGSRILGRFQGMPEADLKAAARILAQISQLMSRFPRIREIELNPLSLGDDGEGAVALEARVLPD